MQAHTISPGAATPFISHRHSPKSRKSGRHAGHREHGWSVYQERFVLDRLDQLSSDVSGLKTAFGALDARIDGIDLRIDRIETRMDRLEDKVDGSFKTLSDKIDVLGGKVDKALETQAFQRGAGWVIGCLLVGMVSTLGWVGARVVDRTHITFSLPTEPQHAMATPTPTPTPEAP
ncbi:hypothetical protein [Roseateles noduli]|uniref:hypothetical protein n=1 Tax=Roseateles noduli TaxID=2052484 RepID=UPI003D649113